MSNKYFKNFPLVKYGQHDVRNIMLKVAAGKRLFENFDNFYPYTVKEGETLTEVSFNYYGSVDYVWVIALSNNIIDPVYDWPLSLQDFENFIIQKYGSIEEALRPSKANYYSSSGYSYYMTKTTYENIDEVDRIGWSPIDNYTYEFIKNEEKRKIRLIDNSIVVDLGNEIEKLLRKVNRLNQETTE